MPAKQRRMNLGIFVLATGNHVAGWRFPGAVTQGDDIEGLVNVAVAAERAKYDFVFIADSPACQLTGHPSQMLRLEPSTLVSALAMRTSRIGLVATMSSTFVEPFNLARLIGSADRISGGRVGWNVVTSATTQAAENFGREIPQHDERYEIATEYVQVVQGLWDSWEKDAVVADRQTGKYLDRDKVHALDHKGKYFSVKGPLNLSRSPQGQPVVVQAGSSPTGQRFAARYGEAIFTVQQDIEEARTFSAGLKAQVAAAGRNPAHCKILPGFFPVVGRTAEEARRKVADLASSIVPGSAMKVMADRYGHDLSQYPLDGPVPELPATNAIQSFGQVMLAKARRENMTIKDLHDLFALSRGYLLVVGTATTVADTMEEWFTSGACDGFMLTPAHFPGALDDFSELVVPELQNRGLFRTDYEGTTLRSHLGLPEPRNRFAA